MFTLFTNALRWIGDQLAVPVKWFLTLPFWDWQLPIMVMILLVCFYGRLLIHAVRTVIRVRAALADAKFDREWAATGRMTDAQFEAHMSRMEDKAENRIADAKELEEIAMGENLQLVPGATNKLYKEADKFREENSRLLSEIKRLRAMRAEYKKREAELDCSIDRVLSLVRQLDEPMHRARDALAQLNKLASRFDWARLVPVNFPEHTRQVMAKTLRMMAGTNNVNEARNAYGRVSQMLRSQQMDWEDLAA